MEEVSLIIREAKQEDMQQVCELIRGLAKFGEFEDQYKINPEILIQDAFDTNVPAFKCFVAELDCNIIGYTIYFNSYSTWLGKSTFLEDIYVNPDYRKRGVGKKLFTTVAKQAQANSSQLHCLSWNNAMGVYKKAWGQKLNRERRAKLP